MSDALSAVPRARVLGYSARLAFGSIWAFRLRSFLTALGVTIGVATVIAIDSIIEGLNASFHDQVASLGAGTLYVSKWPWLILDDWWKYSGRRNIEASDADYLRERLTTAKAVVPFAFARSSIHVGTAELGGVRVIGSTDEWPDMSGIQPAEGRFISFGDLEANRPVVAIGSDVADAMRKEGVALGDTIKVGNRPMKVVGIMPSRGSVFGQSQDDFVVIPLGLFRQSFGRGRSFNIGVVVEPDELDRASDEITGVMRVRRRLAHDQEDDFSINAQQMFVEFYKTLTRSLYATAIGLALITLIVGGVGIMNIMLVAVAERTQEIGVRKALGARPGAILAQFLAESALVSGAGGLFGTGLGLVLAKLIRDVSPLPATVPPEAIAFGIAFGILVGVGFGFLPALRAARLTPVVALRAE